MRKYALDTNSISFLLKENTAVSTRLKAESDGGSRITIPLMVYYEIKRGLLAINSSRKMQYFERFCDALGVGDMSFAVLDRAAYIYDGLRRIGRLTDDADIVIAAYCIVNDCILVTNNTRHFDCIEGLVTEDWSEQ